MNNFVRILIFSVITICGCKNSSTVLSQKNANRLINESSPYLLQHAYNPVDWHPWGEEAFQKAEKENKLLIISVGYSACHWCHVMEHESFENDTVAEMMNKNFVSIKVDREERPDVDDIYMSAASLVSGRGGWPLNAVALPDGRPIWAGTYFPKDQWMNILSRFAELMDMDYARLESGADQLAQGIRSMNNIGLVDPLEYDHDDVTSTAKILVGQMDQIEGGRRGAPKFPMPNGLEYLLRYGTMYDDKGALEAVHTTLEKMAMGGIYDQAGGGFSRYSVDEVWLVPHFEKMLYDNGQLVSIFSDAYRLTGNSLYKDIIEQSLEFVERELMNQDYRFYSALDADSDGEEGKFYVWTETETNELFPDEKIQNIVKDYYNITRTGNWEHGNNILHRTESDVAIAARHNISTDELVDIIKKADAAFLEKRKDRIRPGLDNKVLTSWNGLMIKGYVDAFKALGNEAYLDIAIKSAHQLIKEQMQDDYRLLRTSSEGKASINAFLDDYALTIQAFLSLYEVTFDESWINIAKDLTEYTLKHFYHMDKMMFHFTSDIDPPLIARKFKLADEVIPSSNSVMARNLHRLGELFYNERYLDISSQMLSNMWNSIQAARQPNFYSNWLQLQLDLVNPPFEVAVSGEEAQVKALDMMKTYRPNAVFMGANAESELPLLKYKYVEGMTMIYVCQNKTCKLPVSKISDAEKLLNP